MDKADLKFASVSIPTVLLAVYLLLWPFLAPGRTALIIVPIPPAVLMLVLVSYWFDQEYGSRT